MFGKKGSKILKLPPVRNCLTLAMTNKLVVIINGLKVPKIKKILLYEMKFPVPNYSCLQNPWLGGYRTEIPVLSVLNWICWTPSPTRAKLLRTPLELGNHFIIFLKTQENHANVQPALSQPVHRTATYRVWRYQMLYNTILTSWWWAQQCSKHVEKYNKLIIKQEFVH